MFFDLYNSGDFGRNRHGAFSFSMRPDDRNVAYSVSQLFLDREIWGLDTYLLDPSHLLGQGGATKPFIATAALEAGFTNSLRTYLEFVKTRLGHTGALRVISGITAVEGFTLAVPRNRFISNFAGELVEPTIMYETDLAAAEPPRAKEVLLPFFERIWDVAGIARPKEL
jgi:hypothetical protein